MQKKCLFFILFFNGIIYGLHGMEDNQNVQRTFSQSSLSNGHIVYIQKELSDIAEKLDRHQTVQLKKKIDKKILHLKEVVKYLKSDESDHVIWDSTPSESELIEKITNRKIKTRSSKDDYTIDGHIIGIPKEILPGSENEKLAKKTLESLQKSRNTKIKKIMKIIDHLENNLKTLNASMFGDPSIDDEHSLLLLENQPSISRQNSPHSSSSVNLNDASTNTIVLVPQQPPSLLSRIFCCCRRQTITHEKGD
jgi:hypothetical protein